MWRSKLQSILFVLSRPSSLVRLGLVAFLLTTLVLRLPSSVQDVVHPQQVQAAACSSTQCEAAGNCWNAGYVAYNGDTGCKHICTNGAWGPADCNTTQQEKDTAAANKAAYQNGTAGTAQTGGGSAGAGTTTQANVCGAGSAGNCSGKTFYSTVDGLVCFPNGVSASGTTLCGRDTAANVKVTTDASGNSVAGNVIQTNQANGGCGLVVQCGCSTGMQQLCLRDSNMLGNAKASEYCARVVCSPIGTNGKVCTPGQVINCQGTTGDLCNASGTGWNRVNAHACGATHTVAYCNEVVNGACTAGATRYQSRTACFADKCPSTVNIVNNVPQLKDPVNATCSACQQGVTQIPPAQSFSSVDAYCSSSCGYSTANPTTTAVTCFNQCKTKYAGATGMANLIATTGACVPKSAGGTDFRRFTGCGTGTQSRYNCYTVCTNGVVSRTCANEPGLSCGAHESSALAQQIVSIEQRFTPTTPTSPKPTPKPTPTPTATCGQPCGANAGGAYCTGSNMACVSGTCRSTLCSVAQQNSQCICASPPPNPPICVDIFASKTDIKLGDQVSFTCAAVANAVSYQFRWGYLTKSQGTEGVVMQELPSTSATSRTSQAITVNKVGRYIAQCRPCAANDLCSEWEPIGNENKAPALEPASAASTQSTLSTQESTTQNSTNTNTNTTETTQTSTSSATTSTSYDSSVCWNKVTGGDNWQSGCKGSKTAQGCTAALVPLTDEEKTGYAAWVAAGSPAITGCN